MVDVEAVEKHRVLRSDHVVILGEAHTHSITWFARLTMARVIGKDNIEHVDIERLAPTKENF